MHEPTLHSSDKLTDEYILHYTLEMLQGHFALSAHGYCCTTEDLWRILIGAAASRKTIEAVCNDLENAPHPNTVRGYLSAQLRAEDIPELERRCNQLLRDLIPTWLRQESQEVAFDLHNEPYYGRSAADDPDNWVCRGQAETGTTYFYRCATAYVLRRGARVTLALLFVPPGLSLESLLERLLGMVAEVGVEIKRLYLDKGFLSVAVLRSLQERALPTILAAPLSSGQGGIRALCRGRGSYRTTHTFRNPQHGAVTVEVALVRTYDRCRSPRRRATWCAFVTLRVDEQPNRIRQLYRRRFGIESSYRMMEQVRARTTSLNAALRFLLMGLALLILNVRIMLHWLFLRVLGSGPRRVASWKLRLDRFARFLLRAVERHYGALTYVDV